MHRANSTRIPLAARTAAMIATSCWESRLQAHRPVVASMNGWVPTVRITVEFSTWDSAHLREELAVPCPVRVEGESGPRLHLALLRDPQGSARGLAGSAAIERHPLAASEKQLGRSGGRGQDQCKSREPAHGAEPSRPQSSNKAVPIRTAVAPIITAGLKSPDMPMLSPVRPLSPASFASRAK